MNQTYKERFKATEDKHPFKPYAEIVYEILLKDIISGVYPPHHKFVQYRMANDFGVSRTPVKQALDKLEQQGFVYKKAGASVFVAPFVQASVDDLMYTRHALERLACAQAAERATNEEIYKLFDLCVSVDEAYANPVKDSYNDAEDAFHLHLVESSHNVYLLQAYKSILLQIRRYRCHITKNWRFMEEGKRYAILLPHKHRGVEFVRLKHHDFRTEIAYEHYLVYLAIFNHRPEAATAALTYKRMLNNPSLKNY